MTGLLTSVLPSFPPSLLPIIGVSFPLSIFPPSFLLSCFPSLASHFPSFPFHHHPYFIPSYFSYYPISFSITYCLPSYFPSFPSFLLFDFPSYLTSILTFFPFHQCVHFPLFFIPASLPSYYPIFFSIFPYFTSIIIFSVLPYPIFFPILYFLLFSFFLPSCFPSSLLPFLSII